MERVTADGNKRGRLLTFTRAATRELEEKLAEQDEDLGRPTTVHSFAISTLLSNPATSALPEPIRIADDWEWQELIRIHLKALVGCDLKRIERAKAELASNWESLEPSEDRGLPEEIRNRFAGTWERHRVTFGYALLAELPFRLLRALEDHPELNLGNWDYLVVDEYQDLNQCDLSVLKQITRRGRTLVAAGDDDQSIYSFRRAHPAGIRRFVTDDYPGACDYTLSVSQRCATSTIEWARHVIEGLPDRPVRPPLIPGSHCVAGEARYLRFRSGHTETEGVARLVKWLTTRKDIAPEDIAVMFRTDRFRAWSGPLRDCLVSLGIRVVDADEVPDTLAEPSNRRFLALARLAVNLEDSLAWWTLLHLQHGIGERVRDLFHAAAEANRKTFAAALLSQHEAGYPNLTESQRTKVRDVVAPTLALIEAINVAEAEMNDAGWGSWLAARVDEFGGCEQRLRDLLIQIDSVVDRDEGLGRFLGQVHPVGSDLRSGRAAGAVRLMTMTASKGLTVRAAIIMGVEDGVIPLANQDPGEERRLLYVAMTRSTEFLYLTWAQRRIGPTARTGAPRVRQGRNRSSLLTHGPIQPEDGETYLEAAHA